MMRNHRAFFLPFLGMAFFFLTGFSNGQIDVKEPLNLDVRKGMNQIPAGQYGSTLTQRGSRTLRLEIHIAGDDNNPVADFTFPRGQSIPRTRGEFSLAAQDSGQTYDLIGSVDTHVERTSESWARERCIGSFLEWVCWYDPRFGQRCAQQWVRGWGWQDIRFYDEIATRMISMDLMEPESGAVAASVDSASPRSQRIYTYRGICQR